MFTDFAGVARSMGRAQLDRALVHADRHPILKVLRDRREAGDTAAKMVRSMEDVSTWLVGEMFTVQDPEVLAAYDAHGVMQLGYDPLGGGMFYRWPEELTDVAPGTGLVEVTEDAPVIGWRYWCNDGPRLMAPFRSTPERAGPHGAGVTWTPGVNTSTHGRCGQHALPHPAPIVRCVCGIRVMQSERAIRRFATAMSGNSSPATAFAEVALWGRVAGPAAGDDWRRTARGQHARIIGPIQLAESQAEHGHSMASRYGAPVEVNQS